MVQIWYLCPNPREGSESRLCEWEDKAMEHGLHKECF